MKQTAVSFLLRELRIEDLAKGEQLSVVLQICEEAKAMEKEMYFEIFKAGQESMEEGGKGFEQYYNEIRIR